MILRHNARHPDDPTPLPQWITESPDNYATLKRPLPESKTERIYIYDRDYRCDPWDEPTLLQNTSIKPPGSIHRNHAPTITTIANSQKNNTIPNSTRHHHVHTNRR